MVLSRSGELWCEDERRSGVLLDPAHPLNGLDFVEYRRDPGSQLSSTCRGSSCPPTRQYMRRASYSTTSTSPTRAGALSSIAQNAKNYLVDQYDFITAQMIDARGFGEEQPLVRNDTPENKQLNRRIEVLVWE